MEMEVGVCDVELSLLRQSPSRKAVSLLVADIAEFTTYATNHSVDALLELHSVYVTHLKNVARATRGVLTSLMGDRVVLSWNAANNVSNYSQQVTAPVYV